jgi:hypothetical protein
LVPLSLPTGRLSGSVRLLHYSTARISVQKSYFLSTVINMKNIQPLLPTTDLWIKLLFYFPSTAACVIHTLAFVLSPPCRLFQQQYRETILESIKTSPVFEHVRAVVPFILLVNQLQNRQASTLSYFLYTFRIELLSQGISTPTTRHFLTHM